ncbi:MAG: hypothetical protein ABEI39_03845 [Halobacteriales archaeon]
MEVRDAVESDADTLSELADGPRDVLRNVIHDRTVKVAEDGEEVVAFLSYDARPGTVYVTQLGGTADACERLLEEPVRFAREEGMAVELLVAEDDEAAQSAARNAGFRRAGDGPAFGGVPTVRYRRDPAT